MPEKLIETVESTLEKTAEDLAKRLKPFVFRLARIEAVIEKERAISKAYR